MELKELKKKKTGDLHRILNESRDKLRDLKFKDANKQLKNIREIREIRKLISRCLTLLNVKTDNNKSTDKVSEESKETNKK